MNQETILRVGGICAIAGALLAVALNVIHPAKAQFLSAGYAVQLLHAGLFYVWAALFFGVAYLFYGFALVEISRYAKLWGQTAIVIGTMEALIGAAQYRLFLATLWMLLLGGLMLRNSASKQRVSERAVP